jgi:hypothetical protein
MSEAKKSGGASGAEVSANRVYHLADSVALIFVV